MFLEAAVLGRGGIENVYKCLQTGNVLWGQNSGFQNKIVVTDKVDLFCPEW